MERYQEHPPAWAPQIRWGLLARGGASGRLRYRATSAPPQNLRQCGATPSIASCDALAGAPKMEPEHLGARLFLGWRLK